MTPVRNFRALGMLSVLTALAAAPAPAAAQAPAVAQAAAARRLSLDDALAISDTVSDVVRIARAGVSRAEGQQQKATSQFLPQIYGSLSYQKTLASEYSGLSTSTSTSPLCSNFAADTTVPLQQQVNVLNGYVGCSYGNPFAKLPFGQPNRYQYGLSLSQNLFTGGRLTATSHAAAAGKRSADFVLTQAQAQLILTVTQTYYDAALSDRLVEIAQASLAQAETTLAQARLGRQVGSRPEYDVLRAQVGRDNARPVVIQRLADQAVAHTRLAQLLRLPPERALELTTDLGDTSSAASARLAALIAHPTDTSTDARAPVLQAGENVAAQEAGITIAKSQWIPQLTLSSAFGRVGYPANELPPAWNTMRDNWTITGALNFPLFTGGSIAGDVTIAQANYREAEAQLRIARQAAELDARDAAYRLMAARAAWEASVGTTELAERAFAIALVRYQEGVSTQTELLEQRLQLEQARANRAVAARDLQVARVRMALIRDLPVSAANGGVLITQQTVNGSGVPQAASTAAPAVTSGNPFGVTP